MSFDRSDIGSKISPRDIDLQRLRRPKKAELIADEIRRWIVQRRLTPGDRLPNEKEIIELLSSSRGTVREALKILEAQGLVEISQGGKGGAKVSTISFESASFHLKNFFYFQNASWAQVYDFRVQVEPRATELAVPHLDDLAIERLEETIAACRAGMEEGGSRREQRQKEGDFHRIVASYCPNPMIRFATLFVLDLLGDYTRLRDVIEPDGKIFGSLCVRAHDDLMIHLKRRDAPRASQEMRRHIEELGAYLADREASVDPAILLERSRS